MTEAAKETSYRPFWFGHQRERYVDSCVHVAMIEISRPRVLVYGFLPHFVDGLEPLDGAD